MKTNPKIFLNKGVGARCASFGSTFARRGTEDLFLPLSPWEQLYQRSMQLDCTYGYVGEVKIVHVVTATLEK